MNPLQRAWRSVREKSLYGALSTGIAYLEDLRFDRRYGTDTVTRFDFDDVDVGENKAHAVPYTATRVRGIRKCLHELAPDPDGCFIDIGSGKGRVLLLAAEYGFKKVVGVEFCEPLCDIARENAQRYARKTGVSTEFSLIHADAALHRFEGDETVFFMFHPFSGPVFDQVVKNIETSWRESPRPIHLIYNNPVHDGDLSKSGFLKPTHKYHFCGNDFVVYEA